MWMNPNSLLEVSSWELQCIWGNQRVFIFIFEGTKIKEMHPILRYRCYPKINCTMHNAKNHKILVYRSVKAVSNNCIFTYIYIYIQTHTHSCSTGKKHIFLNIWWLLPDEYISIWYLQFSLYIYFLNEVNPNYVETNRFFFFWPLITAPSSD